MISILIFTFYIINQVCFIILHQNRLVFLISEIKYCLTEVLEQQRGGTPALNVMAIRDQCHANVSKQRTLLADADVAPITKLVNVFHREMNCNKNASFISGDCNKKHPLHSMHTHTHTHTTTTTTITRIKAWAYLDFISESVTVKRQWL